MKRKYSSLKSQEFVDGNYKLRTIQDKDIMDIRIWRNKQIKYLRQEKEISTQEQKEYFKNVIFPSMEIEYPNNILFGFVEGDELIGYGGFVHIDWINSVAELSFLLNPKQSFNYCNKFSIFFQLILEVIKCDYKITKIVTETYNFRPEHLACLESLGFTLENSKFDVIKGLDTEVLFHKINILENNEVI